MEIITLAESYRNLGESSDLLRPNNPAIITVDMISIIGSIFNIALTFIYKTQKCTIGKMVVALSVADLIANCGGLLLLVPASNEAQCKIIGTFMGFGYSASLFWTCNFAHSLIVVTEAEQIDAIDKYFRKYCFYTTLLALAAGLIGGFSGYLSLHPEGICWHQRGNVGFYSELFQRIVLVVPCLGSLIYCFYCYIYTFKKLRNSGVNMRLELMLYPLILIVCYLPFTIGGLSTFLFQTHIQHPWDVINHSLLYSQGFFNSIAYGLSGTINATCLRCCMKSRSRASEDSLTNDHNNSDYHHLKSTSIGERDYLPINSQVEFGIDEVICSSRKTSAF